MAVTGTPAQAGTTRGRRSAFRDLVCLVAIGGFGLAGPPFRAEADTIIQAVESGKRTLLARYGNWTPSCEADTRPELNITRSPMNGFVSVRDISFLVSEADADDPACRGLRVKGKALYYQSLKHYRGEDAVGFEVNKGPRAGAHMMQLRVR